MLHVTSFDPTKIHLVNTSDIHEQSLSERSSPYHPRHDIGRHNIKNPDSRSSAPRAVRSGPAKRPSAFRQPPPPPQLERPCFVNRIADFAFITSSGLFCFNIDAGNQNDFPTKVRSSLAHDVFSKSRKTEPADLSTQRTRLANQQSRSFARNEGFRHAGEAVGDGAGRDEGTRPCL